MEEGRSSNDVNIEGISEDEALSRFDNLVKEGIIQYGPNDTHELIDEGYPFEFRICPGLSRKPHSVGATNTVFDHTQPWGPGSDMFLPDERLILCHLNKTHDLALNIFCGDRPQLLMLTQDSYLRQHEPLGADDFNAALELLKTWKGWYVIFNCGLRGGCSRIHKHLQGLRGPPYAFDVLINEPEKVPYKFFIHRFENGTKETTTSEVLEKYLQMLEKCKSVLDLEKGESVPHNLMLWEDWMVVLPRNSGKWKNASANTGGMLGSIWVPSQDEIDNWKKAGYANVLKGLGVDAKKDGKADAGQ